MSASKYTVERHWSNGFETCPRILEDGRWVADVVGAPHLGHDSVQKARELAAQLESHADLLAACEALDAFQKQFAEAAWEPDRMPGNELYSGKAMEVVRMARAAIAKTKGGTA